jgi:hypothetical protein
LFQLSQQDLENDFDMYIGPEMSVAFIDSPNPFSILSVGIGNSHPSSSLQYEQSNHRFITPPLLVLNNIGTNLHTPVFEPSRVTRYCADDIIVEIRSEFAIKCQKSIKNTIVHTPIHYILT